MKTVFISYVKENFDVVNSIAKKLKDHEIQVWLDRDSLIPGENWKDAIRKAIRSGDFFLACFSTEYHSKTRSFMNEELVLAIEELRLRPSETRWFIPIVLSGNVPSRTISTSTELSDIQYVDFTTMEMDEGIERILRAIIPDYKGDTKYNYAANLEELSTDYVKSMEIHAEYQGWVYGKQIPDKYLNLDLHEKSDFYYNGGEWSLENLYPFTNRKTWWSIATTLDDLIAMEAVLNNRWEQFGGIIDYGSLGCAGVFLTYFGDVRLLSVPLRGITLILNSERDLNDILFWIKWYLRKSNTSDVAEKRKSLAVKKTEFNHDQIRQISELNGILEEKAISERYFGWFLEKQLKMIEEISIRDGIYAFSLGYHSNEQFCFTVPEAGVTVIMQTDISICLEALLTKAQNQRSSSYWSWRSGSLFCNYGYGSIMLSVLEQMLTFSLTNSDRGMDDYNLLRDVVQAFLNRIKLTPNQITERQNPSQCYFIP